MSAVVWVLERSSNQWGDDSYVEGVYASADLAKAAHPNVEWVPDESRPGDWTTPSVPYGERGREACSIRAFTVNDDGHMGTAPLT